MKKRLVGLLASAILIALTGPSHSAPPTGRIAFIGVTASDEETQIFLMNADGGQAVQLTRMPGAKFDLRWSPDGTKLLFTAGKTGKMGLYVISADGGDPVCLDTEAKNYQSFAWSPDGSRILYWKDGGHEKAVYAVNPDGTGRLELAGNQDKPADPSWSPDGKTVLMILAKAVYVMNADGTDRRKLSKDLNVSSEPIWSPDGTRVAYFSSSLLDPIGFSQGLYLANLDGGTPAKLSGWPGELPLWSPNGSRIAFVRVTSEKKDAKGLVTQRFYGLTVVDVASKKDKTMNCQNVPFHSWSPDGKTIAFHSILGIVIVNTDWTGKIITVTGASFPIWSPDGRICYVQKNAVTLANPDGTGAAAITDGTYKVFRAFWSPR